MTSTPLIWCPHLLLLFGVGRERLAAAAALPAGGGGVAAADGGAGEAAVLLRGVGGERVAAGLCGMEGAIGKNLLVMLKASGMDH